MATGAQSRLFARPGFWLAAALLLLGVVLRLTRLGFTYLWIDEITVVSFAEQQKTVGDIIAFIFNSNLQTGATGQHMPMMYSLVHIALGWQKAWGGFPPEVWVRVPFVVLSILTLPVVGLLVRRVYGPGAGLWALALIAISFFHVFQGRDATSYAPLMFFSSVCLLALAELWVNPPTGWKRFAWAALLLAGTLGTMGSHLTGWFLIGTVGMVVAGTLVTLVATKRATFVAALNRLIWIIVPIGLAVLPFLKLVPSIIGSTDTKVADVEKDHFTFGLLAYQFAHFGWGREGGRDLAFVVACLAGAVAVLAVRGRRGVGAAHLALAVMPALVFFLVLHRNFFPRYITVVYLPWLALAAVGLDRIGGWLAGRIGRPDVKLVYGGVVAVLLALGHAEPYRLLYNLTDKFMPVKPVHEWLQATVPEGGLYIWRNGYHLREIPMAYPLPGRSHAGSDYPNSWVTPQMYQARSDMARRVVERFPLAGFIEDPDFDPVMWAWMKTSFSHRQPFRLETLDRLQQLGLSTHGYLSSTSRVLTGCWNVLDDIRQRSQVENRIIPLPIGKGWQYAQTQDGQVFVFPREPDAELLLLNGAGLKGEIRVKATGYGVSPGYLGVKTAPNGAMATHSFPVNQSFAAEIGVVNLDGSDGRLFLSRGGREGVGALIYAFEIGAARPPAGGN